jgi:hypothetical protein
MSAQSDLPVCPITLLEITDPVMDCNGHTFERVAIEQWYRTHDTSPITNQVVSNKNLVPNYALKQIIEAKNTPIQQIPVIEQQVKNTVKKQYNKPKLNINQYINNSTDDEQHINLEVNVAPLAEDASRMPLTCICVIDVSGSMGERATEYNPNGENDGFSRLDLVKHSLNTIHQSLSGNDEMALITFNQYANIILAPTTVDNTELISTSITTLRSGGNTNLWIGLKNAIDMAKKIDTTNRNVAILVLTDGVSNYDPPRGLIPTFDTYISGNSGNSNTNTNTSATGLKYTIHTFAYGYEVDSEKLAYIATKGNGIFGFIPDGTMVGTIFINAMSNILSTAITNLVIDISTNHHLKYHITSKMQSFNKGVNNTLNIGSVLYGQTRNILIQVEKPFQIGEENITGIITNNYNDDEIIINACENVDYDNIGYSMAINNIVSIINTIIINVKNKDRLNTFLEMLKTQYPQTPFIQDLATDILDDDPNKGQIGKSVAHTKWYNKWGCHYLRSVLRAYELQQCLNFKDLAPQHFAGETFKGYQSQIETTFSNITPPEPSILYNPPINTYTGIGGSSGIVSSTPTPTRSYASIPTSYYNVSGGCFTGNWLVNMADSTTKPVRDIKPGDMVVSKNAINGFARVVCILKLRINNYIEMISLNGYDGITSYHPIYTDTNKAWVFPETYTTATYGAISGEYMYDFILDSGHTVNMQGGFNFACLGHGITTSPVISHPYFGTNRIIDDLKDHDDWTTGYITLDKWQFVRNSDNLVVKLEY